VLPRAERLQSGRDFAATYARKKSWASPLVVLYVRRHSPEGECSETRRFGFSVSKKVSKSAVVRNRVKRRLRAICRAHGPHWRKGFDAVIVARSACVDSSYAALEAAVCALVGRAGFVAVTVKDVGET